MFVNNMSLKFDARPQNESFARSVVGAFCVCCNPTVDVINDIKTAISEAVTNCIVHGYENQKNGEILIEATIADNTLKVKISDYGKGIVNIPQALEDFYTTREDEDRSGLGFTIMKSFMDSLEVESSLGCGTTVTMTKRLL
ncbi:MAG: anti-sigma F factor [Christensenellales bacterium]|jgi:stage II sporulation protein AB (anti-sigma F factor)|nr:anti-sigma F factor [Clostridiales bacterium]